MGHWPGRYVLAEYGQSLQARPHDQFSNHYNDCARKITLAKVAPKVNMEIKETSTAGMTVPFVGGVRIELKFSISLTCQDEIITYLHDRHVGHDAQLEVPPAWWQKHRFTRE
eukprot:6412889-Amphidinium_carterae.2